MFRKFVQTNITSNIKNIPTSVGS